MIVRSAPPSLLATCLLGLVACGEAQGGNAVKTQPLPPATLPVLARGEAPAHGAEPTHPITPIARDDGPLEHPEQLQRFFHALTRLKNHERSDDVRVVHFGDSHVAADLQTGAIRRTLQAELGDGGRGFVSIGEPWKRYMQEGVRAGAMVSFTAEWGKWKNGHYEGDGLYGLGGIRLSTNKRGSALTELRQAIRAGSSLDLHYLEWPQGGTFEVYVDGARAASVPSKGPRTRSAFQTIPLPAGARSLEVRALGNGEVRIFGGAIDAPEYGLVYDAIGRNGARAANMLDWDEAHFAEQLSHRAPQLVVLSFGTNEAGDPTPDDVYTGRLQALVSRILGAAPEASCMLVGPPDRATQTVASMPSRREAAVGWETMPRVLELIALQRRVAEQSGCAFYDQLRAMGGAGTIARWVNETPPRAQKDHVHLTRDGYVELGTRFAQDLLRAYAATSVELDVAER